MATKSKAAKNEKLSLKLGDVEEFLTERKQCSYCGRILEITKNFYLSSSKTNKNDGRMNLCKACLNSLLVEYIEDSEDIKIGIYKACRSVGVYFTEDLFNMSYSSIGYNANLGLVENGLEVWKVYIKNVNSLKQYSGMSFDDGIQLNLEADEPIVDENVINEMELEKQIEFKRNREDIIKILGYYPFDGEDDQELLCGQLITFLGDEDIKDDAIKLNAIISIIRTQRAVDTITKNLSDKTRDIAKLDNNLGSIKQMSAIQKDLSKAILDTAKDNKLTDLWSGKKTAGANSLTGTLYKLRQINLDDINVNLFDIRTSKGMEQVAKQSAKGIVDNLTWGDDVSMEMIKEQRILIDKYYKLYISLKEENRKLKVLCSYNGLDYTTDGYIEEVEWEDLKSTDEITREEIDRIISDNESMIAKLEEIEEKVFQGNALAYSEEVIKEVNEREKQKMIEELTNNK